MILKKKLSDFSYFKYVFVYKSVVKSFKATVISLFLIIKLLTM